MLDFRYGARQAARSLVITYPNIPFWALCQNTHHQLRRAIPHENSGKFRVDTEEEQQIWSECSRLIANAIILYNACLLSKLLLQMKETKKIDLIDRIKKVSPIAWRHVNLGGRYEFTTQKMPPNIEAMILKDDTVGHFGSFVVTGPNSSIFFEILLLVSELQCFEISNRL